MYFVLLSITLERSTKYCFGWGGIQCLECKTGMLKCKMSFLNGSVTVVKGSLPMFLPKLTTDLFSTNGWPHQNRPFPSFPGPLFQNEGRCSAFDMEITFHSHANKTHFYKKGCAPSLILKVRVLELGSGILIFCFQKSSRVHVSFSLFSPVHMYSFWNRNGYWPQIILKDLFLWTQLFDQKVCLNK